MGDPSLPLEIFGNISPGTFATVKVLLDLPERFGLDRITSDHVGSLACKPITPRAIAMPGGPVHESH